VFYLGVPETLPGPWFGEDSRGALPIKPRNPLRVPHKLLYNIRVDKVVQYPTPEWTTPGFICLCFTLKLTFNLMAVKLEIEYT